MNNWGSWEDLFSPPKVFIQTQTQGVKSSLLISAAFLLNVIKCFLICPWERLPSQAETAMKKSMVVLLPFKCLLCEQLKKQYLERLWGFFSHRTSGTITLVRHFHSCAKTDTQCAAHFECLERRALLGNQVAKYPAHLSRAPRRGQVIWLSF